MTDSFMPKHREYVDDELVYVTEDMEMAGAQVIASGGSNPADVARKVYLAMERERLRTRVSYLLSPRPSQKI